MTAGFRISNGVDLDNVFDPYVAGTQPSATGYRTSDGVDLNQRYAPILYGTAAATTGFRISSGADLNTLFAAYGTASYALPIDGGNYSTVLTRDGTAGAVSSIAFTLTSGTVWALNAAGSHGSFTGGTFGSGSVPTGAVTIAYTVSGITGLAAVLGTTGTHQALSGNPSLTIRVTAAGTIGTASGSATVTVIFYNSSGTAISTSTYTANVAIVV